jgi:type II secretory pathway pseudopilin PulG
MEKIKCLKWLKSERAITLVEVLAVLALLSMVVLLASSIYMFSQKQMIQQSSDIQVQSNVRLAAKILTKDIRKSDSVTISTSSNFAVNKANLTIDRYEFKDKTLYKNDQPFISDIQSFTIKKNPDDSISLSVANLPETTILIRKTR